MEQIEGTTLGKSGDIIGVIKGIAFRTALCPQRDRCSGTRRGRGQRLRGERTEVPTLAQRNEREE